MFSFNQFKVKIKSRKIKRVELLENFITIIKPTALATDVNVVDDAVYEIVEQQAGYPGGFGDLKKYLDENINYPEMARELGVTGKVYVSFLFPSEVNYVFDGMCSNLAHCSIDWSR